MEGINSRKQGHSGFTIVELLVVIVVIAILAAITIVAYNGIQGRAIEATMKNDLQNAASVLELDNTRDGSYPATATAANGGVGLKTSGSNVLTYTTKSYGYCVMISNPKVSTIFAFRTSTGAIASGDCTDVAMVSTLAGSGTSGFADGTGTAAQFANPTGVAVDSSGTVYVADSSNNRIRKITPAGVVTTLAASGTYGFADGTGTAAQFANPTGVAVDSSGTVYVADAYNKRIRKITQ